MKYVRPIVPNAGLGNKLFPWARAFLIALDSRSTLIPPSFFQIKCGPMLRGESDWRLYSNEFRNTMVTRWLLSAKSFGSEIFLESQYCEWKISRGGLLLVEGMDPYFMNMLGREKDVYRGLQSMTRKSCLQRTNAIAVAPIAIHVRLSDFKGYAWGHPIEWYIQGLRALRDQVGDLDATIVSDGTDKELAPLLAEPATKREGTGSAIGDILLLSKCQHLVATGSSSFSAWAAYLGGMPVVTRSGNPMAFWNLPVPSELIV